MSGRILVVDDLEPNRKLLKTLLEAEYYEVEIACDGQEAVDAARANPPDLILLDVMMPRMDGFEACRILKSDAATRHVPVVMVTALDQQENRIAGLEAGADDFLTKPVDDIALFSRVKNLLRLKSVMDELRKREASGRAIGVITQRDDDQRVWTDAKILIVDDPGRASERLARRLEAEHKPMLETDPRSAAQAARGAWDMVIIDLAAETFDGMRLAARLRSDAETRNLPILAIADPGDRERTVRALEIGVHDVLSRPVDRQELSARVRTIVKRKRYADYLRATLDEGLEAAVTDQLTGLHNRRFMTSQLNEQIEKARESGAKLTVLITDLDHFKRVNDTHGHDAGDAVLQEFARRMSANTRAIDMACRFGGEEFVVVMPEASVEEARIAAERLRESVGGVPFELPAGAPPLSVTVSAGVAELQPGDTPGTFLKRADEALYAAKTSGRNRVVVAGDERQAA